MRTSSVLFLLLVSLSASAESERYWMRAHASQREQRARILELGTSPEATREDYVIVTGGKTAKDELAKMGVLDVSFPIEAKPRDLGAGQKQLEKLHQDFPAVTSLESIGQIAEGQDIYKLRISGDLEQADSLPGVVFLSDSRFNEPRASNLALEFADDLLKQNESGNLRVRALLKSRTIEIIPDVDLTETRPEMRLVREFLDKQNNLTFLVNFRSSSKWVLYPWGHQDEPVADFRDRAVFETVAKKFAQASGARALQSSDLFITQDDLADWAYASHGVFGFTFGVGTGLNRNPAKIFDTCLDAIDLADSPYRAIEEKASAYGLRSPLVD